MSPIEAIRRARIYRSKYGTRRMVRETFVRLGRRMKHWLEPKKMMRERIARVARSILGPSYTITRGLPVDDRTWIGVRDLLGRHVRECAPLRLFLIPPNDVPRVSLVTDSISRSHLYGGVGTAIILAALLAQARGARLRLVTRSEPPHPEGLETVLDTYGIRLEHDVELAHAPFDDEAYEIDQFEQELFITTSWWTTAATLRSVRSEHVVYLLQEDERMFYPLGDVHLRCARVLENPDIRFIVNSRLLFDHLVGSGLANIAAHGTWFEPSFPREVFYPRERPVATKRTLVFYARPNNLRNLFFFGVQVLEAAIARGIIDLTAWELVLVGKEIPDIRFDDGRYIPQRQENLSWTEYAALAGKTDLALCLMYTPHPSYPPFDMAASGAVVVTNRYGNKQDLSGYSPNILCADLDLEAMLQTLSDGMRLAADSQQRSANFSANKLQQDWKVSFAEVVDRIGKAA